MDVLTLLANYYDSYCDWLISNAARLAAIKLKYPKNRGYLSRERALFINEAAITLPTFNPVLLSYYLEYRLASPEIQSQYEPEEVLTAILYFTNSTSNGSKKSSNKKRVNKHDSNEHNDDEYSNNQIKMISVLRPGVVTSSFRETHESESERL